MADRPGAALMKPLLGPNSNFDEAMAEARQRAGGLARDTQGRMRETQERVREAQERAVDLARARALEAQELARRATETMPPGLLVRLLSSLIGIPLLLLLVFAEGSPRFPALPFTFAVSVCAMVGALEYFRGLRLRGFQPNEALALIAITLLQFAAWNVSRNRVTAFLPALIAVLVVGTLIYEVASHEKEPIANIGVTFFGVVYVGWLFSYLIFLRSIPGELNLSFFGLPLPESTRGAWTVLYVFAVTWSTDAGAYFVGMRLGRHKLAPRLSPNKTIEGAVGGILAATLVSMVWGTWIGLPWWHCAVLGPLIGILGQVGDLCESALKRDIGVKDFGMVLPGHGGILDRFDSLLFTAPLAYYYLQYFVVPLLNR
ncbi:MAG: phosphatidate cytidylyltransferase [Cytophagales bacterium]|nr:phosphatidate cytidylyltransferase [Armatimonadota bacterium]